MKKTALITGPTSGIGLELAKIYAHEGYDLVLVARSADILNDLKKRFESEYQIHVTPLAKDLSKNHACLEVFYELERQETRVDVLVNNAGFGSHGPFHTLDTENEINMIDLNVTSLTYLTRLFLPKMVERRWGRVLNVASTAAFQPGPFMAVYYATKAYVLSFSEALSEELRGTGVRVTALCPGPVHTKFSARARMSQARLFSGAMMLAADKVARIGYEASMKGKSVVIAGVKNKILAFSNRLAPRGLVRRVVRSINVAKRS